MTDESQRMTDSQRPLQVGLLLDSFVQPAWVHQTIADIDVLETARIAFVARITPSEPAPRERAPDTGRGWSHLLHDVYLRWDKRRFGEKQDALAECDVGPLLENCPVVEIASDTSPTTDGSSEADPGSVWDYNLDVILNFGACKAQMSALPKARYGVWWVQFGDGCGDAPSGFWEVLHRKPTTEIALRAFAADSTDAKIIDRCSAPTHSESVTANRDDCYWRSSSLVVHTLNRLHKHRAGTWSSPERHSANDAPPPGSVRNGKVLWPVVRLLGRQAANRIRYRLYENQWFLAFRFRSSKDDPNDVYRDFKHATPPKGRFWADPFPVCWEDRYYIFLEDGISHPHKGRISLMEVLPDGTYTDPEVVIERDYHMSYPYVFRFEDSFFMIPETYANNSLDLYVCTEFPTRWELHSTLMPDVEAFDATLYESNGRWWMFVVMKTNRCLSIDLFLFYAQSPLGPWLPHTRNPVRSNARSGRCAGKLLRRNGKLLRPAQDCSHGIYGRAISIQEVLCLNTDNYEEREVGRIEPDWAKRLSATHTLNSAGDLTVIDGCRSVRR